MLTAQEAKQATKDRLLQLAKEYIINVAQRTVSEAINKGRFQAHSPFDGTTELGEEVVKLLKKKGFDAKHVFYDEPK